MPCFCPCSLFAKRLLISRRDLTVVLLESPASFRTKGTRVLQPVLTLRATLPQVSVVAHRSARGLESGPGVNTGDRLEVTGMNPISASLSRVKWRGGWTAKGEH
jgi:hypothetical protein